ncbi:hypothetical protein B0H19DRAFT_1115345 [Mycena capillaripes]|nr:hypothetical protein B0H19DRAFT_1115345 [Mycena capillaripes]
MNLGTCLCLHLFFSWIGSMHPFFSSVHPLELNQTSAKLQDYLHEDPALQVIGDLGLCQRRHTIQRLQVYSCRPGKHGEYLRAGPLGSANPCMRLFYPAVYTPFEVAKLWAIRLGESRGTNHNSIQHKKKEVDTSRSIVLGAGLYLY